MEKVDGLFVWSWRGSADGEQTLEALVELHFLAGCDHQERAGLPELPLRARALLAESARRDFSRRTLKSVPVDAPVWCRVTIRSKGNLLKIFQR